MPESESHPMYTCFCVPPIIHCYRNSVLREDGIIPAGFASIGYGRAGDEKQNEKQPKQQFSVHLKTS